MGARRRVDDVHPPSQTGDFTGATLAGFHHDQSMTPIRRKSVVALATTAAFAVLLMGCGGDEGNDEAAASPASTVPAAQDLDRVVKIDGDRGLFLRCTGSGSPTLVLEGGDGDTSASYSFAEERLANMTRTCVYDRANLGSSDPAPGPRGLDELVGDLEALLEAAKVPAPYVLVGTSGGGYITAGLRRPESTAGGRNGVHRHRGSLCEPASRDRRGNGSGQP
jgi:hypothetical protein